MEGEFLPAGRRSAAARTPPWAHAPEVPHVADDRTSDLDPSHRHLYLVSPTGTDFWTRIASLCPDHSGAMTT
jgi:hypothetical protein